MTYDVLHQPVLATLLIQQMDVDSFFNPAGLEHTGFAFDGNQYAAGVKGTLVSSWGSEAPSQTRGAQPFPTAALVIVNRASLTILDESTPALDVWMTFYFGDKLGFTNNALGDTTGYIPKSATWNNGVLSIIMAADTGATSQAPHIVSIDFVQDQIYLESHS